MGAIIYNLSISLFSFAIKWASLFHPKARLFIEGRKNQISGFIEYRKTYTGKWVWFHCASLGEFEQGRTLMEMFKQKEPYTRILLTFFSPSGYEVRKSYNGADYVMYLPIDKRHRVTSFLDVLQPSMAIFIKYEYWANYFFEIKKRNIPLFIVSGIFRPDQRFFGIQKSFWKKVFSAVTHFYLQNESSAILLQHLGFANYTLSGDTRFDRVMAIAQTAQPLPYIENFILNRPAIVLGSSYPAEESMLAQWLKKNPGHFRLIIVPHEVNEQRIASIENLFPGDTARYSAQITDTALQQKNVFIVDTIGLLSQVYQYATLAIIGGGFGKGIHNTLEAAVYGVPILFGPVYQKFEEAKGLLDVGGARSVKNRGELESALTEWYHHADRRQMAGQSAKRYIEAHIGATSKIFESIHRIK